MNFLRLGGRGVALGAVLAAMSGAAYPSLAWQTNQPETLHYRIAWGPLTMGRATLSYTPPPSPTAPYTLVVALRDRSALVEFNSRYTVQGRHTPRPFTSATYHALQQENDYRADKLVVFDGAKKQIRYTNARDAADSVSPLPWDGKLRDTFSQLYAWRLEGVSALQQGRELQVMGTKRPFTLVQQAPQRVAGPKPQSPLRWRVPLRTKNEDGSFSKETWQVILREEADKSLIPTQIIAQTRYGTFTATLQE